LEDGIVGLFFWLVKTKGNWGALVGPIVGAVSALAMYIPSYLETGIFCDSEHSCEHLRGRMTIDAVIGATLGAILGTVLGFVGLKLAPRIFGPDREKAGSIVGGFIGGVAPWLILLILSLTSGDY